MNTNKKKLTAQRDLRAKRARAKIRISGRPRLSVFKSNAHLYAQVIDDSTEKTLAHAISKNEKGEKSAKEVGKEIAEKAKKVGVDKVVFDKGKYAYHGVVRQLAEGAREGGLKF